MIRALIHGLAEHLARRHVRRRSNCLIDDSAKVQYRGMRLKPPTRLTIGAGSIFEGRIMSDRDGSEVSIGANTFVGGSTLVCAQRIEIGDDVLISWGCTIVDHHSHAVDWVGRAADVADWYRGAKSWDHVKIKPVKIGDRAWVGFNSIVLPGVTIGENAVVGCGSVVTRDVAPYTVVAGNPARVIRSLEAGYAE